MPQEEFASAFRIGVEWILNGFRSWFRNDLEPILRSILVSWGGLGGVLGLGGSQDRILIDFRSILGPLLGPSRPQLGGLGASFGVLGRSFGGLEPFYLRSYFQVFFGLHFASISDPRTTPKSFKNQLIIRVKIKLRKRLISTPFPSKFQENVMLKTKTSTYQKCAKTCSFC